MEGWEGQIDVDDSDLQSVLRPPLLHSSCPPHAILNRLEPCSQISSSFQTLDRIPSIPPFQSQLPTNISEINQNEEEEHPKFSISRPLIPGPAGAIQAAMRRRSAAASSKRLLPEEEGSDDLDLCVNEEDGDFKLNPWLYSLSFLGQGKDSNLPYPISLINAQRSATQRIPQVVGIVKSCTPNGLGDFFITLKDPTGTIGAAIHRKVLSEGSICREVSVGCVFILKQVTWLCEYHQKIALLCFQVVALCPAHSSCYLNITLKNVVKSNVLTNPQGATKPAIHPAAALSIASRRVDRVDFTLHPHSSDHFDPAVPQRRSQRPSIALDLAEEAHQQKKDGYLHNEQAPVVVDTSDRTNEGQCMILDPTGRNVVEGGQEVI
ncbi:hypothetical protein IEQ34_008628 [Dendrobium chrysotoxum]|uniref:Homologous recombination OB-fold protein OB-fold domain-containing protein n=1 Tax=Dendrobium chrysotoxum TaxID=161865 RepID=A0AAV7GZG4_DENCH|nr:hypothetical protein IEQ34_008628 [Dendrobium chrysotoxum]